MKARTARSNPKGKKRQPAAPAKAKARKAPAPSRLELPPIEESVLPGGLTVLLARRPELPLVSIRLMIQAGSAMEPPDRHGLADFTLRLLRRGVTGMGADAINEAVEFVGASLDTGAAEDYAVLRITTPAEHVPAMLEMLGRLVREPSFPEEEVQSARARTLAELASDLDNPALLAERGIVRALWGEHPYGHEVAGSAAHVARFTREDVVRFHRERMGPRVAMLIAVGDLDPASFTAAAERAFRGWSGGPDTAPALPGLERAALEGQVVVVDKPDQTQSQVRIGVLAFPRAHPDYMPAYVVNAGFGGGFTSRLVDAIRVKRGLSYGAGSALDTLRAGGWLGISTFTKTASTREIIDVALEQAALLRRKGLTPSELARTQRYVSGTYPLRTETNEAIAAGIGESRLYGLGDDWMARFRERVHAVTPAEATRVAARHFFPGPPTIVVLGRAAEVQGQLSGLGPVRVWSSSELE